MKKRAVLALSGGMDSTSLLLHLLSQGYEVKTISFDYGQKHFVELERAKRLTRHLSELNLFYPADFHLLKIPLKDLVSSTLMKGGEEVPEGHYQEENMKETVVPNRNKIFSSIIQAAALSWANETDSIVEIALGIHAGDHLIYPDTRKEFRDADYKAFLEGNWDAEKVVYKTPFIDFNKASVLYTGMLACEKLGLDFNKIYSMTNTSYKPILIDGFWYSDYKSASSVERVEAFIDLELVDPVKYADETGPVDWDTVVREVEKVLKKENE